MRYARRQCSTYIRSRARAHSLTVAIQHPHMVRYWQQTRRSHRMLPEFVTRNIGLNEYIVRHQDEEYGNILEAWAHIDGRTDRLKGYSLRLDTFMTIWHEGAIERHTVTETEERLSNYIEGFNRADTQMDNRS